MSMIKILHGPHGPYYDGWRKVYMWTAQGSLGDPSNSSSAFCSHGRSNLSPERGKFSCTPNGLHATLSVSRAMWKLVAVKLISWPKG